MMLIDTSYFLRRIGSADERPKDRQFWSALAMWQWQADWKRAKEADDWAELDRLDRQYEIIVSI